MKKLWVDPDGVFRRMIADPDSAFWAGMARRRAMPAQNALSGSAIMRRNTPSGSTQSFFINRDLC